MCSSRQAGCRVTTPARYWPRSAAKPCPAKRTSRKTPMASGRLDGVIGGQADGLERDLRRRIDGDVRIDADSRAACVPFVPLILLDGTGAPGRTSAVLP